MAVRKVCAIMAKQPYPGRTKTRLYPKLSPQEAADQMQANLSSAVGAPVSVKGKRTEGVAGLQGGVQGHAVALLWRPTQSS